MKLCPASSRIAIIVALLAAIASASSSHAEPLAVKSAQTQAGAEIKQGTHFTMLVEGSGPDVILIPGLSTPRDVWTATADRLKAKYRVHILQVRGFGDDAGANAEGPILDPLVVELADYIGHEITGKGHPAPFVIGHSFGGLTGLVLAAKMPDKVGKLMVVDAVPFTAKLFGMAETSDQVKPLASGFADQIRGLYGKPASAAPTGEEPQNLPMSITAEGRKKVAIWSASADLRVTASAMYDDFVTDMRPELPKITAPVTLLYSHDETTASGDAVKAMFEPQYAGVAKFTPVMIDGSRHFIMLDQPAKFAAEVDAFLK